MIDIVKLYFVEYFRPHLRNVRIFLHGMWAMGFIIWALPGSHYSSEIRAWVVATLVTSLVLDAWDWVLRRHEAKARKEELYEYYRSEFETEKFHPVNSGAPIIEINKSEVTDEDIETMKEKLKETLRAPYRTRPARVITDEQYRDYKAALEQEQRRQQVTGWVPKDEGRVCLYGGGWASDCTHYECKPASPLLYVTEDTVDKDPKDV